MMKHTQYFRKGRVITKLGDTPSENKSTTYPSINKAKKESRKLQPISGDGTLAVIRR